MRQKTWKVLLAVIVLHPEQCPILARSNWTQIKDKWYDSKFKQSNRLFEKECEKWRTWICLDVLKNRLNAKVETRTKAFHHNHRVTLTVVTHTWKDHSLYTSFGCTVFDHEIHILWATSHLEGIKGFMDGTLRTKETRHVHQTPLKLHSYEIKKFSFLSECLSALWFLLYLLLWWFWINKKLNNTSIHPAGSWYWMDVKNWRLLWYQLNQLLWYDTLEFLTRYLLLIVVPLLYLKSSTY